MIIINAVIMRIKTFLDGTKPEIFCWLPWRIIPFQNRVLNYVQNKFTATVGIYKSKLFSSGSLCEGEKGNG